MPTKPQNLSEDNLLLISQEIKERSTKSQKQPQNLEAAINNIKNLVLHAKPKVNPENDLNPEENKPASKFIINIDNLKDTIAEFFLLLPKNNSEMSKEDKDYIKTQLKESWTNTLWQFLILKKTPANAHAYLFLFFRALSVYDDGSLNKSLNEIQNQVESDRLKLQQNNSHTQNKTQNQDKKQTQVQSSFFLNCLHRWSQTSPKAACAATILFLLFPLTSLASFVEGVISPKLTIKRVFGIYGEILTAPFKKGSSIQKSDSEKQSPQDFNNKQEEAGSPMLLAPGHV